MRQDWVSKIQKFGNSYGVILPINYLRFLKMDSTKQWVSIVIDNRSKKIVISKAKKPKIKY